MIIQNKRCSRAGCWNRGILWERDGNWTLECTQRMQRHFEDASRDKATKEKESSKSDEQKRWEKAAAGNSDPSSSSGTSSTDIPDVVREGMAVAACPPWELR